MKPLPLGILLASGLLAGVVAQRLASRPSPGEAQERKASKFLREEAVAPVVLSSTDTVESLKDPHAPQRMSRIALWLKDASLADIEALWKEIQSESPPNSDLWELVLGRWVMIDPQHALLHGLMEGSDYWAWSAWANFDPRAAYEAARASGKSGAINAVVGAMGLREPEFVFGLLEKGEDINLGMGTNLVNGFIARGQFERAIRALQLFKNAGGGDSTDRIFGEWIKKEPEAALKWLVQNPRGISGVRLEQAMRPLVDSGPEQIRGLFAKLPTGLVRHSLEKALVQALAEKDPAAARAMAMEASSPTIRAELLGTAGFAIAKSHPREAAGILRSLLDQGISPQGHIETTFYPSGVQKCPDGNGMVSYFIKEIAVSAPGVALDEMMMDPENKFYRETAEKIAGEWMERDAWDFSKWLKEQAAGETRDAMALSLARRIAFESSQPAYKEALEWAASVGDPGRREDSVSDLIRRWSDEHSVAFEAYLASSAAPAAVKEIAGKNRGK